jgi:two-component system sensor histidine kinase KdpD
MPGRVRFDREFVLRTLVGGAIAISMSWIAFRLHANLSTATSLGLLLVIIVAHRWGFTQASLVSILSVLCLDFFFIPPIFQLSVHEIDDWVALAIFEIVALSISHLSTQAEKHARLAEEQRQQLQRLNELGRNLLFLDPHEAAEPQLVSLILDTLGSAGVALWNGQEQRLFVSGHCETGEAELRALFEADADEAQEAAAGSRRVLRIGTRAIGALAVDGPAVPAAVMDATAALTAIAIERSRSIAAQSTAEAARQSEQLRSAVLDGLAHAIKTPLTTIRSSSSGLIAMNTLAGPEKKLVALIDREAEALNQLTTRLLRTARIEGAEWKLRREWLDLAQLIDESTAQCEAALGDHAVSLETSTSGEPPPEVWADRQMLKLALVQLFENAGKYASPHSGILVGIEDTDVETVIRVGNEGSFVPPEDRQRIFNRFYRGTNSGHREAGTGIGLAVVKRVAEAHQGRTWVESDEQTGTQFSIALPKGSRENGWETTV